MGPVTSHKHLQCCVKENLGRAEIQTVPEDSLCSRNLVLQRLRQKLPRCYMGNMSVACIPQKAVRWMRSLQQQEATQWTTSGEDWGWGREDHLCAQLYLWNYAEKYPRVFLNK